MHSNLYNFQIGSERDNLIYKCPHYYSKLKKRFFGTLCSWFSYSFENNKRITSGKNQSAAVQIEFHHSKNSKSENSGEDHVVASSSSPLHGGENRRQQQGRIRILILQARKAPGGFQLLLAGTTNLGS